MDHNALVSTGSQIIKNWTGLAFLLILVVGAFLRFAWLGTVRHGYDNAYQIYDAVRLLDGGEWLLIGQPSSVFLDNPPLMAYLQSIALLVWRSPWSAYLLVTTLNTAAIWFVYTLGSDLKGRPFGLLAALLFAVNPWLVHYSRFTWTQGLLPFFLAAAAWGLWPALATGRREPRRLLLGLLALAAMIQTYVLALVVLAPVVLLLIVFRQHLPRRSALAGLLAILLGLVAYALGLSTRLEANLAKLALFASGGDGAGLGFNLEAIEHTVRLVTGNEYGADLTAPLWLDMLVRLVHLLLLAALLAGAVRALRALRRDTPDRRLAFVLFAWLLLPALGFALLPFPVHPHYLLVTLPAGQFLAAWGLHPLVERPALRPVLAVLLVVAGLSSGLALRQTALASAAAPVGGGDFDGWALSAAAAAGAEIREATAGVPGYPRRVAAGGNSVLLSGASATYLEVVGDLSYPDYVLLPEAAPLLYVLVRQPPQAGALGPREERLPGSTMAFADGSSVFFARVQPTSRTDALALPTIVVDWGSEAGLSLLGYELEAGPAQAGETLPLTTVWRVEELPPARGGWYAGAYYQILDEAWQLRTNVSGRGQWGWRWAMGDTYVERVVVPLPEEPGEYRLLIGLHDPIHGLSFGLQSPEGPQPFLTLPLTVTP